jgi:hypothetical protein
MSKSFTAACVAIAAIVFLANSPAHAAKPFEVPLLNPSFSAGVDRHGVPLHWSKYGGGKNQDLRIVDGPDGGRALLIADGNPTTEFGVVQTVALRGAQTYQVAVKVRAVEGASTDGAYLQFRFLPSQLMVQVDLAAESSRRFNEVSATATAPPDTTRAVIYLYTHRDPTPKVIVTDVRLLGGLPPPPPPPPEPIPPQYAKLKNLHLEIPLVEGGRPSASIVVPKGSLYAAAAAVIRDAIQQRTGVAVPVVTDQTPAAAVPIQGNLIVLGNRSTNRTISALYDRYYALVDLKYPGPEGYAIRSVHNPFGNGRSVLLVGASDTAGVDEGARVLAGILAKSQAARGALSIGWTMETRLGRGVKPPTDIREFETWEASKGYGSVGYFGWTSISKRMAMYYMTGDAASAREVVRLSFPDPQAIKDIEAIDGERIENKHDPLAGFYHYNAHMAILFWDLIEESPVFTDAERLRITNAFARQLDHRKNEGVYRLTQAPRCVGSRHGQWSAICLYCLGRYFNKDYADPIWAQCERAGQLAFHSLHKHAWLAGESDNLFWYNTGIAPIFTYMLLTGDRKPLANGVLAELLRGQEMLISGRVPDWALHSAAMDFLNKAAYVTGDGRWITYRQRTGVDTDRFRLGQSFWPDESIQPRLPTDLVGRWSFLRLPKPAWSARASGIPRDQSFAFGSFRSAPDAGGDYILLDGFNGASRNPYHTFDVLELRLASRTLLQGYHNQVITSADGMVEPVVAMDAALLYDDVLGPAATVVAEVPKAAFCNWRRTLCQRTGRYAVIVDDLAFRTDSRNMKVTTTWQPVGGAWDRKRQALRWPAAGRTNPQGFELRSCDDQDVRSAPPVTMAWSGAVKKGEHRKTFSLIAPTVPKSPAGLACTRLADNAAAMAMPQPALAVAGQYAQVNAELAILAGDHLHGHAMTSAGVDGLLLGGDSPLDLDWDLAAGVVEIAAPKATALRMSLRDADHLQLDGRPAAARRDGAVWHIALPAGRHTLTAAWPAREAGAELVSALARRLAEGQRRRAESQAAAAQRVEPALAELPARWTVQTGAKTADMIRIPDFGGASLCVAVGNTLHLLSADGKQLRRLQTDGPVRVLRWWDEPKLLLAGCTDEKLIAFDATGRRRWVFVSEMDPAVYEAAKTYWFKSAPGHEGIHGLWTGPFDQSQNRCFVGSACTLEILDPSGQLVKRTPVFWGPGWKFLLVPGPDQSRNLLVARWPNGADELSIVNSRTMTVVGRGYYGVPSGHALVGGWTAQNRTALRHEDIDGDGRPELVTAINGTWNRVTVYSEDGRPRANAQFGPGPSTAPRAQMRDLDLADLDGDGKKEIVVGISEGLLVALDHRCQTLWSTRLPSPPLSLRCVTPPGARLPWIVAACDDGSVFALDAKGAPMRLGRVAGRTTHLDTLQTPAGPLPVLATDRGEIKAFTLRQ